MFKNKKKINDIEPCCELCEYASKIDATGELLCKYKSALKKVEENDCCKKFSLNIFAYKPKVAKLPKAFDFTKI